MYLFRKKSIAGVEIDAYEIRVTELAGNAGAPKLLKAGRKVLPAGTVREGKVLNSDILADTLASLWKELNIGARDVILGVNNQDVIVRFAYFPKVTQDKVDNLIRYQAQEYLPISMNDVEFDYVVVGEEKDGESEKMKVLLVAARRNMIADFLRAFDRADLKVLDIDMSTLAVARLLPKEAMKSTCAAINIGYEQTNILILDSYQPQLARSLITEQRQAEDDGIGQNSLYKYLATGNLPVEEENRVFDAISGDIRNSINYFQSQVSSAVVGKIYLCGCGSRIRSLPKRLEEYSGIPVETLKPFGMVNTTAVKGILNAEEAGDFSISISLAMRNLEV